MLLRETRDELSFSDRNRFPFEAQFRVNDHYKDSRFKIQFFIVGFRQFKNYREMYIHKKKKN